MGLGDNTPNRSPSSPYLPSVKPNQQLTPSFVGKIINAIDSSTPRFGNGYQIGNYATGSVMRFNTPFTAGAPMTNFMVTAWTEKGQSWATVSVGTVNRRVPKIGSKYLDQPDANGLFPKIQVLSDGYVVLEAKYEANKPFPDNVEVKFVATLGTNMETNVSTYALAKVVGKNATHTTPAMVLTNQMHLEGNLAVNRYKIGTNIFYWQWYTV